MNVVVVGAGIAGSCAARVLRERGHTVTVVSDGAVPHSVAATAVLRSRYHREPAEAAAFTRSLEIYRQWGVPLVSGGAVTNYRTPAKRPKRDADWTLINPADPLVPADVTATVTAVAADRVTLADGEQLAAEAVVVAAGCDSTLSLPGATTYGVTWTHPDPAVLTHPGLRVHHMAPYKTLFAGNVGGAARLGSSSSTSLAAARRQGDAMLNQAWDLGIITSPLGWHALEGARLKTDRLLQRRGRVHYFTGLHRTGYALAPAYAHTLARRIEGF